MPGGASPGSIQERLERAQTLNITAPITESRPLVEELLAEIDQSQLPGKQAAIRLLADSPLLDCRANSQEALDMAGRLLQSELDTDQRLSALRLTANIRDDRRSVRSRVQLPWRCHHATRRESIRMTRTSACTTGQLFSQHGRRQLSGRGSMPCWRWNSARRSDSDRLTCVALGWLAHAYKARAMIDEAWAAGQRRHALVPPGRRYHLRRLGGNPAGRGGFC